MEKPVGREKCSSILAIKSNKSDGEREKRVSEIESLFAQHFGNLSNFFRIIRSKENEEKKRRDYTVT